MQSLRIAVCGFLLLAPLIARADDAERRALAEKLLVLTDMQKNTEKSFDMIKQMLPGQMQQSAARTGQPPVTPAATAETQKMIDAVLKEFSWDSMKEEYISIYAQTFTEDELKGIIAFYDSPAGRKFTEKQPELMKRSMELSQKKMLEVLPKLQVLKQAPRTKTTAVPIPAPAPTDKGGAK